MTSQIIQVKEHDGGGEIGMELAHDLVFIDAGGHTYAFDQQIFLRAVSRMLNISVILDHGDIQQHFVLP